MYLLILIYFTTLYIIMYLNILPKVLHTMVKESKTSGKCKNEDFYNYCATIILNKLIVFYKKNKAEMF